MRLTDVFHNEIDTIKEVVGAESVQEKLDRLDYIFNFTEEKWYQNLERYGTVRIDKLLIAEAPPWTATGEPRYFYNQIDSKLHEDIWHGIIPDEPFPESQEDTYLMLAQRGFLLVDSLPFAMKYKPYHRRKATYKKLIKECSYYWLHKLANPSMQFSDTIRVAFAFKLNALAIIEAIPELQLSSEITIALSESMILADGSGFPKKAKIGDYFCPK